MNSADGRTRASDFALTRSEGRESESANPNGSMRAIAGVANEPFNVFGLMPHPEHAWNRCSAVVTASKFFNR